MKLFSWMQNKLHAKQGSNKTNVSSSYKSESKEEFSDWPQGFLSIGTLGSKDLEETTKVQNHNSDVQTHEELTPEEVRQLQKELNALVSSNDLDHLALFETKGENNGDHGEENGQHIRFQKVASNNNKNNNAISKKSVSFLLKKMFFCGAGLGPKPSLRDPTLSPPQTRMEKILRALLHKKIYPQNPSPSSIPKKKYLENKHLPGTNKEDHDDHDDDFDRDQGNEGSKWVKTDTEFIVLEI